MTSRKIIIEPDPILRKKCEPLEHIDESVRKLMNDMLLTMYAAPGIGLAAIQVGVLKRIVVIDISKEDEKKNPLFLVNPAEVQIKYVNYEGEEKKLEAKGLLATCIQHEIDHLNGILFIDYLSKLKKDMIIKKLIKHKKDIERIVV